MTDKTIINTKRVRGLGNIVSPKTTTDFIGFNSKVSSSTDLVDGINRTVYQSNYLSGSYLTLTNDRLISPEASSFSVTALLKYHTGNVIYSADIFCVVNGVVYTATTDNQGVAVFTVPCDDSTIYKIRVYYPGTNSVAGCLKTASAIVGDIEDLTLTGSADEVMDDDTVYLLATLTYNDSENETIGVPFQTIVFYEKYVPTSLRLHSNKSIFEIGDSVSLSAKLVDDDGSAVIGEIVNFKQKDKLFARDDGTSVSYNDTIWSATTVIVRGADYSYVHNENGSALPSIGITGDMVIELDLMASMNMQVLSIRESNGSTQLLSLTLSQLGMTVNEWKHIKIIIKDNKATVDGTSIIDRDITDYAKFHIRASTAEYTYFKNLRFYTDVSLGSDTTDETGIAEVSYTPVGYGNMVVEADYDTDCTDEINMTDAILYDSLGSDTSSNYYVNTGTGNSLEYVRGKGLKLNSGTSSRYVQYGHSQGITDLNELSKYRGKKIRFKAYVEPTTKARVTVHQYINGSSQGTASSYTANTGYIYVDVVIDPTLTRLLFRVDTDVTNEVIYIKDWQVYPV